MDRALRIAAFVGGMYLMFFVSMSFSVRGFQVDFMDTSTLSVADAREVETTMKQIGVGLALVMIVPQFILSSTFVELNITLILLGVFSYVYSIQTNVSGIASLHGGVTIWKDYVLGIILDVAPEPMIAFGLGKSLDGDLVLNLYKTIIRLLDGSQNVSVPSKSSSSKKSSSNKTPKKDSMSWNSESRTWEPEKAPKRKDWNKVPRRQGYQGDSFRRASKG